MGQTLSHRNILMKRALDYLTEVYNKLEETEKKSMYVTSMM
jgi:hypothetical protein